jgi:flavin-dependent dehydrogenase
MTPNATRYDAVVVGARCAGAATAMLLARRGLRVLAVDRSRYGSDTLSTHALMRAGVLQLHRWGVLDCLRDAGTPPVTTTTFHYGKDAIEIRIKPRDGVDALYAPRRTVIDPILVDAARESGAEVRHGVRLVELLRSDAGRIEGALLQGKSGDLREVRAGIVIGADGVLSSVARLAGAATLREGRHATANIYGYWSGIDAAGYHWRYRPGLSAGTIPTNDGLTCVFLSLPPSRFEEARRSGIDAAYRSGLAELDPALAAAVETASPAGKLHLFSGIHGFLRQTWGPGWALVGDASYFKDPLTAHGMTDALRDAELLARAVAEGTDEALDRHQRARDDLSRRFFEITDQVASFSWDLETVRRLHLEMSEEMGREAEALLELDRETHIAA